MRVRFAVGIVLATSLSCLTQANATQYNWTYGGDGHHSGSGILTTIGETSPFTITDITGTFDSSNIVFPHDPGDCCGNTGNDNLLYSPPSTLLDGGGLAFETSAGTPYQIFFNSGDSAYSVEDINEVITFGGTFTATAALGQPGPAPVPEPSSPGIVGVGFVCATAFIIAGGIGRVVRPSTADLPHVVLIIPNRLTELSTNGIMPQNVRI